MQLRFSPTSPYVRKVRVAAAVLGLADRIALLATDTLNPDDPIAGVNPLGKVPALTLDDGTTIYDSRVICEYLDAIAGGRLIPAEPLARARAMTGQALADGILDASILQRYEAMFHEPHARSARWVDRQSDKVARALAVFEAAPPEGEVDLAQIALACALGYLDFRFEGAWRAGHPGLVAWLEAFAAKVPAYGETAPNA
ncbi:MAG: glutathione S-transferase N-terminal domain-containing protein [Rhizobiales bacterium]|nr:glutathione S-transferase N-terminal domain-containing protein [Hyphomicrobiales bacterium]